MIIDQSLQERIELLKKIDNKKVQDLIEKRIKDNPSKRTINHWLFSSNKINLQKIVEINAIMSKIKSLNRDIDKSNSIEIATSVLYKSLNKKITYLDSVIINYLCSEDESLLPQDDVSFCLKLTEILDKNFGWYSSARRNDFFIILSIKDRAKAGTLLSRDLVFLKKHFSSKINLLNKSSAFKVGDIVYYCNLTPGIVFEQSSLDCGSISIKLFMNDSIIQLFDFEISLIKKSVRTKK
jgi:hypothetical protein